jgi:hypothetical protein
VRDRAAYSIKTVVHRTDCREEHLAGESIKKGLHVNIGIVNYHDFPHLALGENIKYLAVRVLNKNREVLISPPGTNRKYRVRLTIPTMDKDFGTTQITYSRENKDRVVFMSSDRVKDAHQVFLHLRINHDHEDLIHLFCPVVLCRVFICSEICVSERVDIMSFKSKFSMETPMRFQQWSIL